MKEKILDDIAKMAGGGAGILGSISKQFREDMRSWLDDFAARMDLVPREDFERLEIMLKAALKRIDALEKANGKPAQKKTAKAKPKTKKTIKKSTKKKKA